MENNLPFDKLSFMDDDQSLIDEDLLQVTRYFDTMAPVVEEVPQHVLAQPPHMIRYRQFTACCMLYTTHYTLHTAHCTLNTAHCTLHTVH